MLSEQADAAAKAKESETEEARERNPSIVSMNFNLFILLMEEIRRSPVQVDSFFPLVTGFSTSQVVQDFLHQQYLSKIKNGLGTI